MATPESRSTLAQQLRELANCLGGLMISHRHLVDPEWPRTARQAADALTSGTPEPANMKVAVAGRMETTIATFQQRCDRLLADEQQKIAPDNALIAVLCDAVRLAREYVELATKPIGGTPEPAPATWQPNQARRDAVRAVVSESRARGRSPFDLQCLSNDLFPREQHLHNMLMGLDDSDTPMTMAEWPESLQDLVSVEVHRLGICGDVVSTLVADWLRGRRLHVPVSSPPARPTPEGDAK
jgi:hypothetical protein